MTAPCLAPCLGFSVPTKMLQFKVPTTMRENGVRGGETRSVTGGETGSKTGSETGGETGSMTGGKTGSKTGSETGSKMGRDKFMLGFRVPTTCSKKTSITTYSGEVSPPPANWTTTSMWDRGRDRQWDREWDRGRDRQWDREWDRGWDRGKTGFVEWICVLSHPLSHSLSCPLSRF